MNVEGYTCPHCGAGLEAAPGSRECICSYCGSRVVLDDNSSIHITKHIIDEARLKEAEIRLKELEMQQKRIL